MKHDSNTILECYLNEQLTVGINTFERLETPNSSEFLWAGQCYFGLDQNLEALKCFYQAHALNLEEGLVFAASVLRFSENTGRANEVLHQVCTEKLTAFGLAAWHREHGLQLFASRQLTLAVHELERAWQLAASDPTGQRLLPRYSQSLALALLELGRDASALQYLNLAIKPDQPKVELLLLRAATRGYTGDLLKAATDLELVDALAPEVQHARAGLVHGFIARSQGLIEKAASIYLETASSVKHLGEWETEFYAELALCALLTEQSSLSVAQAHLTRARGLVPKQGTSLEVYEAMVAIRHAALLTRHGNPEAISLLEQVIKILEHHGLERDLGIAQLHLAEAYFQANQQTLGLRALARAVNARHALGSQAYFALELRALSHVFELVCVAQQAGTEVLRQDWLALEAYSPHEVHLITLGDYAIRLNGQSLKLEAGTVKAVEFLAYLLEEGEVRIDRIINDLFSEGSYDTARNRIHKLRESISRHIPGLMIPHCKDKNTYSLEPQGVRLRWDLREVRKAVQQGGTPGTHRALALYTGGFLAKSEGQWAETKRFELEFDLTELGLEALKELFALERHQECLRLAERLSELAGFNLGVQLMLLKATARVHGAMAARERLLRVDVLIRGELQAMPELQLELRGVEQEFLN